MTRLELALSILFLLLLVVVDHSRPAQTNCNNSDDKIECLLRKSTGE